MSENKVTKQAQIDYNADCDALCQHTNESIELLSERERETLIRLNEIHPTTSGFKKIFKKIYKVMRELQPALPKVLTILARACS